MLSNAHFLAKIRFDTVENEPAKNLQNFATFCKILLAIGALNGLYFLVGAPEKDRKSIAREIDPERFGDVLY